MLTTNEKLRYELEFTIEAIVEAVGGDGACEKVGYLALSGGSGQRPWVEHRFWVIVPQHVKGAIVGKDGANANRLRELVKTRATVLGNHEPIDVRVISCEDEAPEGVFAA